MVFDTFDFVEWVAFIVAIVGIIKITILSVNRNLWINRVALPIIRSKLSLAILAVLTVVLFYYFIQFFTIIQIFALIGLFAVLYDTILLSFNLPIEEWVKKYGKNKLNTWQVIVLLAWLVLSIWVLFELF